MSWNRLVARWPFVSVVLVLAGLSACSAITTDAQPTSRSATPVVSAQPSASPVTPRPSQSRTPRTVADTVPLSRYPIFKSPCKFLRKVKFIDAMGDQTWRATEEHKARGDAGWEKFSKGLVFSDGAAAGSRCFAMANTKRVLDLNVWAFDSVAMARTRLADDQDWPGLGEQADLGSVRRAGSGVMRVGRVLVQLVVFYDGVEYDKARLIVRDVLIDLRPGLPTPT